MRGAPGVWTSWLAGCTRPAGLAGRAPIYRHSHTGGEQHQLAASKHQRVHRSISRSKQQSPRTPVSSVSECIDRSIIRQRGMSGSGAGVWVFRNGVMQLEQPAAGTPRKALVYVPTNEVVRSVEALERRLASLGWERYYENRSIVQLHKRDGGADLITIPRDFASLRSTHMYDVVVKNRDHFKVVDA